MDKFSGASNPAQSRTAILGGLSSKRRRAGGLGSAATWNINASSHSQTFLGRFVDGKLTEINGKIQTGCASGIGCGYGDTLRILKALRNRDDFNPEYLDKNVEIPEDDGTEDFYDPKMLIQVDSFTIKEEEDKNDE